jgi:hypothetical protein
LQSILKDLGLERRAKPLPSLAAYIVKKDPEAKKDASVGPSSQSRPSSTLTKPFSSSSSEETAKKDAPPVFSPQRDAAKP